MFMSIIHNECQLWSRIDHFLATNGIISVFSKLLLCCALVFLALTYLVTVFTLYNYLLFRNKSFLE